MLSWRNLKDKVTMHLEADLMKLTPHSFPLTSIFLTLEKKQFPNIENKLETLNINRINNAHSQHLGKVNIQKISNF